MRKDDAKPGSRRPFDLTPREKEVLECFDRGLTPNKIADELGVGRGGIYNILRTAREKRLTGKVG